MFHFHRILNVCLCVCFAYGSHYRGGFISWKPYDSSNATYPQTVKVTYRIGWRSSTGHSHRCDDSAIQSRALVRGEGTLVCKQASCFPPQTQLSFICTDSSLTEDWSLGQNTVNITINSTVPGSKFKIGYSSCCWIGLAGGSGGSWSVFATVNLSMRADTGKINSSPQPASAPIIRVQQGCKQTIKIAAYDPDNDHIRCRFASGYNECGGICNGLVPYATLNQTTCTLTFDAKEARVAWYGATFIIEDFANPSDLTPLSSVPLQFLIRVSDNGAVCIPPPSFVAPTFEENSCNEVDMNVQYKFNMTTVSGKASDPVVDISTSSPEGTVKKRIASDVFEFTWMPKPDQVGLNLFCGNALSQNGLASAQRCFTFVVRASPVALNLSMREPIPGSIIVGKLQQIILSVNKKIVLPISSKFVNIYAKNKGSNPVHQIDVSTSSLVSYVANNTDLRIDTSALQFDNEVEYIVTLDDGNVNNAKACNVPSVSLLLDSSLTFKMLNCKGRPDGDRFADPDNCEGYIKCVFGEPSKRPCAPGTGYMKETMTCGHKRDVGCNQGQLSSADGCSTKTTGVMLPHPTDCHQYIICVHGNSLSRSCPPGTRFYGGICNHEFSSDCDA